MTSWLKPKKRLLKEVDILTMKMNDVEHSIYLNFNTIEIIYFYDFLKMGESNVY
jgi:hypothetical protein